MNTPLIERANFAAHYPDAPTRLSHHIAADERFSRPALLDLLKTLPAKSIEYNSGDLPIDQKPEETPSNGLSPAETVERIGANRSWMVFKNIERASAYRQLMETCLQSLAPTIRAKTGALHNCQAYLFLSSPGAMTPFHMDPEHNILLQLFGAKTMTVYPRHIVDAQPPEIHEAFHAGTGHRNLRYCEAYERDACHYRLEPGDAVYLPVKIPHRVRVAQDVSISLSITWRSRASDFESALHLANHEHRRRGGKPRLTGAAPWRDRLDVIAFKARQKMAESKR